MKIKGLSQTIAAWKMLLGSLPRGIVAFVIAVAGLSIGLPLALFVIGLPILVGMLAACERIMGVDRRLVANWESNGNMRPVLLESAYPTAEAGWFREA